MHAGRGPSHGNTPTGKPNPTWVRLVPSIVSLTCSYGSISSYVHAEQSSYDCIGSLQRAHHVASARPIRPLGCTAYWSTLAIYSSCVHCLVVGTSDIMSLLYLQDSTLMLQHADSFWKTSEVYHEFSKRAYIGFRTHWIPRQMALCASRPVRRTVDSISRTEAVSHFYLLLLQDNWFLFLSLIL